MVTFKAIIATIYVVLTASSVWLMLLSMINNNGNMAGYGLIAAILFGATLTAIIMEN